MEAESYWQRLMAALNKGGQVLASYHMLERTGTALEVAANWLGRGKSVGAWSVIVVCAVVMAALGAGYHEPYLPWYPANGAEVPDNWQLPGIASLFYHFLAPYLKLTGMVAGVVFHVALLRSVLDQRRLIIPVWLASGFLAAWIIMADFYEQWERVTHTTLGQPHSAWAVVGKALALGLLIFAPAIVITYYQTRRLWEKNVLSAVVRPLAFCYLSIACLVVLFDLDDNLKDFQKNGTSWREVLGFYVHLLPKVFVEATSPSLTLAALFGLVRLVRFNEIISLLNSGLSLFQITRPLIVLAAFVSLLATSANYHWAPMAEAQRSAILLGIKNGGGTMLQANAMHYEEAARRTWYIGMMPYNLREEKMRRVQVREYDGHGRLVHSISAPTAVWWPQGVWSFFRGQECIYENGVVKETRNFNLGLNGVGRLDKRYYETPWDIIVPLLSPDDMGVQELAAYLEAPGLLTDTVRRRHYFAELCNRFSIGWQGLCMVLLTIPLVCHTSRKAVMSGSGLVMVAFVINHFVLNNVFAKLAYTGLLHPGLAAALPHVIIGLPALFFLWLRSEGLRLPRLWQKRKPRDWRHFWRRLRGRRTRPWKGRHTRASWLNDLTRSL